MHSPCPSRRSDYRSWGGTIAVLQSSDVGLSVYRSMGFEQVAGYYLYARPSPAS